jgi:hypothetical protein
VEVSLSTAQKVLVSGGLALAGLALIALAPAPSSAGEEAVSKVERGRYLVTVSGCHGCHTPRKMGEKGPEPDLSRLLAGHPAELVMPPPPALPEGPWNWVGSATVTAFAGPWGISYARNLTPDPETGLGRWSEAQFVRAMRTGKHLGIASGRPILPPMPWSNLAQATDEDLSAMWAYLASIPAIRNDAPQSVPAPPPVR